MKNLELEDFLSGKLRGTLLDLKNLLIKIAKNGRIAHRPLLVGICKLDEVVRGMRLLGPSLGLQYPKEAPLKSILGPSDVQDHLHFEEAAPFPLPPEVDVLDGVQNVSPEDRKIIEANLQVYRTSLKGYQENVARSVLDLYKLASDGFLTFKNNLNLFFAMASHNDASLSVSLTISARSCRKCLTATFSPMLPTRM